MTEKKLSPDLLVSRGLFPENLPSIFTARKVWPAFESFGSNYSIKNGDSGDISPYNASKRGNQRRLFGLPHPAFLRDQAIFFEKHWPELSTILDQGYGSASKIRFVDPGLRHVRITSHSELPKIRLRTFSKFKFCLVADVSRFHPSIYTHTIPWAINGKMAAKTDFKSNSATIFGNRLDFIVRQAQARQTIGIPVGPDTSKIVSELLMSSIDSSFIKRSGRNRPAYVRHVDDYWIAGNSYEECEKHLQSIRQSLREFGLDINESKTKIISTKYVFSEDWPFEFNRDISEGFSVFGRRSGTDPMSTLGKIVDRATVDNDEGIVRHAIRRLDEERLWDSDWEILEHFLAQCAVQFPHSLDYVARVISWRLRTDKTVNRTLWSDVAKTCAAQSGAIGRDSETLWSLWLLKELNIKITKAISDVVISNLSALVLSFLANCYANGLTNDKKIRDKLCARVGEEPFAGTMWPLTLELSHLDLPDRSWSAKKPGAILTALHDNGVSIIDWGAPPRVFDESRGDAHGHEVEPEYAIEDFGLDYGDDEENTDDDKGNEPEIHSEVNFEKLNKLDFTELFVGTLNEMKLHNNRLGMLEFRHLRIHLVGDVKAAQLVDHVEICGNENFEDAHSLVWL